MYFHVRSSTRIGLLASLISLSLLNDPILARDRVDFRDPTHLGDRMGRLNAMDVNKAENSERGKSGGPELPRGRVENGNVNLTGVNNKKIQEIGRTIAASAHDITSGKPAPSFSWSTSEEGTNKVIMQGNLSSLKPAEREKFLAVLDVKAKGGDSVAADMLTMISSGLDARFQIDIEVSPNSGSNLNNVDASSIKNFTANYTDVRVSISSTRDFVKGMRAKDGNGEAKVGMFDTANATKFGDYVKTTSFKVDTAMAVNQSMGTHIAVQDLKIQDNGAIHVDVPSNRAVAIQSDLGAIGSIRQTPSPERVANPADHAITLVFTPASAKASVEGQTLQPSQIILGEVAAQENEALVAVIKSDPNNKVVTSPFTGGVTITSALGQGITVGPGIRAEAKMAATGALGLDLDQFTVVLDKSPGRDGTQMVTARIVLNEGVKTFVDIGGGKSTRVTSTLAGPIVHTFNPMEGNPDMQLSAPQLSGSAIAQNRFVFMGASVANGISQAKQDIGKAIKQTSNAFSEGIIPGVRASISSVGKIGGAGGAIVSHAIQSYKVANALAGDRNLYTTSVASPLQVVRVPVLRAPISETQWALNPTSQLIEGLNSR